MSEYQFYDFLAVDRPLTLAEQAELRGISTRARITATRFTNEYEYGDLKRPPQEFMRRWFDLHLYFANWGTRCLSFRWPAKLVDAAALEALLKGHDLARIDRHGEHVILDLAFDPQELGIEDDLEYWDGRDGDEPDEDTGRLPDLVPLRDAVIEGDLRLFLLIWLLAVQHNQVPGTAMEPVAGLGPLTPAMHAFAAFLSLDLDLLAAAGETGAAPPEPAIGAAVAAIPEAERVALLTQIAAGEPHAVALLRRRIAPSRAVVPSRSAEALLRRAVALRAVRKAEEARRDAARKAKQAAAEARARRQWLDQLAARGDAVWSEIDAAIARRNAGGYKEAALLLGGLRDLAKAEGTSAAFARRVAVIVERVSKSPAMLRRLDELGLR